MVKLMINNNKKKLLCLFLLLKKIKNKIKRGKMAHENIVLTKANYVKGLVNRPGMERASGVVRFPRGEVREWFGNYPELEDELIQLLRSEGYIVQAEDRLKETSDPNDDVMYAFYKNVKEFQKRYTGRDQFTRYPRINDYNKTIPLGVRVTRGAFFK